MSKKVNLEQERVQFEELLNKSAPQEGSSDEVGAKDFDTPIFENGPTQNQIDEWKSRYGEIYVIEFDEERFIFRPLKRLEYKEVAKIKDADSLFKEERICEKCVLWPENYGFTAMSQGKAGYPSQLADYIFAKSGWNASEPIRL